jgi:1-deoxy-D-xylulose-5-phosphate synthase
LPVIFGIDRGGLVEDGETHQGVFDIAYLRSIPNLRVFAPRDAHELRDILYTLVRQRSGPAAVRFPRDRAIDAEQYKPFSQINLTAWETLHKGRDMALIAYGSMVETARQAMAILAEAGIEPTLVNARSAKPLDGQLLSALVNDASLKLITLEEGCLAGGFGAAVLEWTAQQRIKDPRKKLADIYCLGIPDNFVEHGSRKKLLELSGLDSVSIADFVKKLAPNS